MKQDRQGTGERIVFLVPYRPDDGPRDEIWAYCRRFWEENVPEFPIVLGASPEGPFRRAAAINDAARAAGQWNVALVLDADVVVANPYQVRIAATTALNTGEVVLGFGVHHAMNPRATRRILDGTEEPSVSARYVSRKHHESSVVAIPRTAWEEIGGFDERFVGWGQEDVAFAQAARVLVGLRRVPGEVYHLWHPRSPERRTGLPEYRSNQDLGRLYRETRTREEMRILVSGEPMNRRRVAFSNIYRSNRWRGKETKAGPGSGSVATEALRKGLPGILEDLGVTSILDAGCSEAFWVPDLPGYVGVDVVHEALAVARRRHPEKEFRALDVVSDDLPRTDAILCRDVLQHLPLVDGLGAVNNFRRSGAKYLLATTYRGERNRDVHVGGWFPSNLEAKPFLLGPPILVFDDGEWESGTRYPTKVLGVWEL